MQTGAIGNLKLLDCYKIPKHLAFKLELAVHRQLNCEYIKRGEWFVGCTEFQAKCSICEQFEKLTSQPLESELEKEYRQRTEAEIPPQLEVDP